ncbi:tannase/feruloyl esterase family alpha/beta hydrolase [Marinomonas sp. A79]|uniref:Tannase/feruloyl esterase family alpha/beta hydrolase n=2 Tax=Marinomonas vulgaris TaxID=2823372 RepID=A0ABS5H920_9GAMM|nr:tannase/feruloyl esterase family alpha/beta hydrolase [Marinomonas vulgaris]
MLSILSAPVSANEGSDKLDEPKPLSRAQRCNGLLSLETNQLELKTALFAGNRQIKTAYCLVAGTLERRMGADGELYAIHFELRLPTRWQGRFAYQFTTDNNGDIPPAVGAITGLKTSQYAINQGFAVVTSNSGVSAHGQTPQRLDPQARRNLGYEAVQKVNPIARDLVERYYQAPIQFSYGLGQADGGRMAMVAASRFPTMFDGLLVGYPGFNAPKAALQHPWNLQALHRVHEDIRQSIPSRQMDFFAAKMLEQCDGLDGLNDGMIFASDACQRAFNPKALVCKSDFDRDCLPLSTVGALMRMHMGPHNDQNRALYSDWVYDAGMASDHWRQWRIESTVSEWDRLPMSVTLGAADLAWRYITPEPSVANDPYALEGYLQAFDFDQDAPKITAVNERFKTSAMTDMTPPDALKPELAAFKQAGGKMLTFHGNSDPVFSVKDTVRWVDFLDFALAGRAHEFTRLYRIPGMTHGQGGPSTDQFDLLSPLVSWVEKRQAPQSVVAATRSANPDVTLRMEGMTRPLCPHPSYAQYTKGNMLRASSFACVQAK